MRAWLEQSSNRKGRVEGAKFSGARVLSPDGVEVRPAVSFEISHVHLQYLISLWTASLKSLQATLYSSVHSAS